MRTQQRTESQCRFLLVLGLSAVCVLVGWGCGGGWFWCPGVLLLFVSCFCERLLVFGTVIASVFLLVFGVGVRVFSPFVDIRLPFGVAGCLYAFNGEFDPGSGRTLAACLTHASRTERPACGYSSGERVSNTWATCPQLWDNSGKPVLILDIDCVSHGVWLKVFRLGMGPRPISLLVG